MEYDFFSGNSDMADFDYHNALGDKLKAATGSKTLLGGLFKAGVKPKSTIQNIKAINQSMMMPTGDIPNVPQSPTMMSMGMGTGMGTGLDIGMDTRSTGASAGEEESFFAKNKMWIIGGGVVLVLGITTLLILRNK